MKTVSDTSKTILVITVGFLIIYVFSARDWPLWVAIGVGGLSVLSSFLAEKIAWLWQQLGYLLGLFVPKIILSLIFFCILLPIALLSRVFSKKDTLGLQNNEETVFKSVNKIFAKDSFEKTW